jgi:chloramphenicol-sensitive protein RarD
LGFLQYVAPTCQFLLAVLVYREPFTSEKLLSFGLIWVALGLYCVESLRGYRESKEDLALAEG